mmetsp:Transcript_14020/g.40351  ORF Transcript_14020/g.40351 Transcript_14020/m.40351 type:complete len:1010 (-) Transcript_14020:416-3445(-)
MSCTGDVQDQILRDALDIWANHSGCACIDINSSTQFVRLWVFVLFGAVIITFFITAPFWPRRCKIYLRKRLLGRHESTGVKGEETNEGERPSVGGTCAEAEVPAGETHGPQPDISKAREHLVRTSTTKNGRWRPLWRSTLADLAEEGGPGLRLYFSLLRIFGILFAYMAALTCASIAFNAISDFAPDNGNILAKTTIGNLGVGVSGITALPPEDRYVILKDADGSCEGTPLTTTTGILAWLDFAATIAFLTALVYFRFYEVPQIEKLTDQEQITCGDYAIEIDHLPRNFPGHEETGGEDSGKTQYERELREYLESRMSEIREKDKSNGESVGKVEELVFVRDNKRMLTTEIALAGWKKDKDIAEFVENAKQVEQLDKKIQAAEQLIADKQTADDTKLDVIRAFAILSTPKDAKLLRADFRFSTFALLRGLSELLGRIGIFEGCCPQRRRMFKSKALRIRRAPEPSNLIWENQDVPFWERFARRVGVSFVFLLILITSFGLVYLANITAKRQVKSSAQLLGVDHCDPDPRALEAGDDGTTYQCLVWNATNWTMDFVKNATADEKACYCGAVGYANILADADLVNGVCKDWLVAIGTGIAIGVLATGIVVAINVTCKLVLLKLAEQEKPLSVSALNATKMVKIFALQTLNTGFVIFCVNFKPPEDFPLGNIIFFGEYSDSVRGWYVVVGAAILANMLANAITPSATNFVVMSLAHMKRCCCRSRQKHHAKLVELYTNPEFDMAARFAQLLNTIFVTVTYSAGMPALYIFCCFYMWFTFWADKIVLLRCAKRPPMYDTQMPRKAVTIMFFAVALHCVFAIWMFGQPCTFPSKPMSAFDTETLAKHGGGAPDGLYDRISKESTWMFFVLLVILVALWVLGTIAFVLGGTVGSTAKVLFMALCPNRAKAKLDEDDDKLWADAAASIKAKNHPTSYAMEAHPNFRDRLSYLDLSPSTRKQTSDSKGDAITVPVSPTEAPESPAVDGSPAPGGSPTTDGSPAPDESPESASADVVA